MSHTRCCSTFFSVKKIPLGIRKYFVYPAFYVGGNINNIGLTTFGCLKTGEYILGYENAKKDPVVIGLTTLFDLCTYNIIRRIRMPGLRAQVIPEEYLPSGASNANFNNAMPNDDEEAENGFCSCASECCCGFTGSFLCAVLKFFGGISGLFNFVTTFLNAGSLFDFFYNLNHEGDPDGAWFYVEKSFSTLIALTAIAVYLSFNISQVCKNAEDVDDLFKGKIKLNWKDKKLWLAIFVALLNSGTAPLFAYFSTRHALKRIPIIGSMISEDVNIYISAFSSATFAGSFAASNAPSVYRAMQRTNSLPSSFSDKFLTYSTGIIDALGTGLGIVCASGDLVKEYAKWKGIAVNDPDGFWSYQDLVDNFGQEIAIAILIAGAVRGINQFTFSTIEGFNRVLEVESRKRPVKQLDSDSSPDHSTAKEEADSAAKVSTYRHSYIEMRKSNAGLAQSLLQRETKNDSDDPKLTDRKDVADIPDVEQQSISEENEDDMHFYVAEGLLLTDRPSFN